MDTKQLNSKFQNFKRDFFNNNKTTTISINETELVEKLQDFKNKCRKESYIEGDFFLDEAYPGLKPTSFIINLFPKKKWLSSISKDKALEILLNTLSDTTDSKIREHIFTLRMLNFENLTSEHIKKLFYDKNNLVRVSFIDFIKTGLLIEQQIRCIFDTDDKNIIALLLQNNNAKKEAFIFSDLKIKWVQCAI